MKVSEALASRRSVRAFLDRPVDEAILRRVIEQAARAPSGGNLQPWHITLLSGPPLDDFRVQMASAIAEHPRGEGTEYDIYPRPMAECYDSRRLAVGEALYGSLEISREDRGSRRAWFARNYRFFDAPVGLFCAVDRCMGAPQWSDLGMYLQSVMLLLREEGLDSCPQECWALYPRTVGAFLGLPKDRMLFCGMAIGFADPSHPVNAFPTDREPLDAFATFRGFER